MALAEWQKISRVKPNQPFGDGSDGALSISSDTTQAPTDEHCTGTATTTALTCTSTTLSDGDVILIHQSRGTGVGQWEINQVASGGGTVNIVTLKPLNYTYTGGASQAQAIVIPMYSSVTVDNTKTWTAKAWGGVVGGILLWACNGTSTITGNLSVNGNPGSTATGGNGTGYGGGDGNSVAVAYGDQGEGTVGAGGISKAANGNGGGGGENGSGSNSFADGGGGGGNGTAGSNGAGANAGAGGAAISGADLSTGYVFAGGGGAGGGDDIGNGRAGGAGGGIMFIASKMFTVTGTGTSTGGAGVAAIGSTPDNLAGAGGGGAGGSILIQAQTVILGSSKLTASGGAGGAAAGGASGGGAGGTGRIAVHYSGSYTGTTSPSLTPTYDTSLMQFGMSGILEG